MISFSPIKPSHNNEALIRYPDHYFPLSVGRELPAARGGGNGSFIGEHVAAESSVLDRVRMKMVVDHLLGWSVDCGHQQQKQAF